MVLLLWGIPASADQHCDDIESKASLGGWFMVDARLQWQPMLMVEAGMLLQVETYGQWTVNCHGIHDQDPFVGPQGYQRANDWNIVPDFANGSLIGRIGQTTFLIGSQRIVVIPKSGILELRINDADCRNCGEFNDNLGQIYLRLLRLPPETAQWRSVAFSDPSQRLLPPFNWFAGTSTESQLTAVNSTTLSIRAGVHTDLASDAQKDAHSAPTLAYPISHNFAAKLQVTMPNSQVCCKNAGFGIRSSDKRQSARVYIDHLGKLGIDVIDSGNRIFAGSIDIKLETAFFYILNRGNSYDFAYSIDGQNWQIFATNIQLNIRDPELFLVTISAWDDLSDQSALFTNLQINQ